MKQSFLSIPRGLAGVADLQIETTSVQSAEARIAEVASVTPEKAPELLATFNKAYLDACEVVNQLETELVYAKRNVDKVRSVIVLERVPKLLIDRGLANAKNPFGSEDIRRAVIDGDEEYQKASDAADIITAHSRLMKDKAKAIEMAFSSVKRILQEQAFNFAAAVGQRHISAGGEDPESGISDPVDPYLITNNSTQPKRHSFAGKNKY
jgi:hypothetical protein